MFCHISYIIFNDKAVETSTCLAQHYEQNETLAHNISVLDEPKSVV